MDALEALKNPKMLRLVIIIGLIITVVSASIAVYYVFFYSHQLTKAGTNVQMQSIYNHASVILAFVADDVRSLSDGNITITTFKERVISRRTDMVGLRTEVDELQTVANPEFLTAITLLDSGLQSYVTALDCAHDLDLESAADYLEEGTIYIDQSMDALPTVT